MSEKLGLIVPVYNVATYLPEFFKSIDEQIRYPDEIILVNDGSVDGSLALLEQYASQNPCVVLISQANGGLSDARNVGLRQSRADLVAFVDPDDVLSPEYCHRLYKSILDHKLDFVLCNAIYMQESGKVTDLIYSSDYADGPCSGSDWLLHRQSKGRFLHMVWMHMYRRTFLNKNSYSFVKNVVHEDVVWSTKALIAADRVMSISEPLYKYRLRNRRFSDHENYERLTRLIKSSVHNFYELLRIAEDCRSDKALFHAIRDMAFDGVFSVFHKLRQIQPAQKRRLIARQLWDSSLLSTMFSCAYGFRSKLRVTVFLTKVIRYALR